MMGCRDFEKLPETANVTGGNLQSNEDDAYAYGQGSCSPPCR
jgi:hypothetical protein